MNNTAWPEPPTSYADSAECPYCASALFAVIKPGPEGYRWSHEPDEYVECPNLATTHK